MPNLRLNVHVEGQQRIFERVRRINERAPQLAEDATKAMAEALKREIGEILFETSNGTTWNSYNPAWKYWWKSYGSPSAAPGDPINYQTGELWQSIEIRKTSAGNHSLAVTAPYAQFHEITGWTSYYGNNIAPRPFVRPASERAAAEYNQIAEDYGRRIAE